MKKIFFSILLVFSLLAGCVAAPQNSTPSEAPAPAASADVATKSIESNLVDGCIETYDATLDYFPQKASVQETDGFSIEYFKHYKVITVNTPVPGGAAQKYALLQCGAPAPDGFEEYQLIEVPVKRFVAMSTTQLPFLDKLGLLDRLVGVDDTTYINNPNVLKLAEAGTLKTIGAGSTVNIEQALDLEPDLIMAYGSGAAEYDAHPKLIEAGLKVVLNAEWLDTSPLGRAEWGKFIAAFFNREADAETLFAETAKRYNELKMQAASQSSLPSVLIGSPFEGTWYVSGGNSFSARFLKDAGTLYPWAADESTGSLALSFEEVVDKAQSAETWINIGYYATLADLQAADERFSTFTAFQTGQVWNNDARSNASGGNDYYESAVAEPDVVLADLIKIFHPDLLPDHELVYYRQVK